MGYRNYFYLVPKNIVNDIQKLDTQKDLANYIVNSDYFKEKEKKEAQKCLDKNDFEGFYIGVYDFGEQLHEFGKLYFDSDTYEAIIYNGKDLFKKGSELAEVYEDFDAKIVGKEALIAVAKCYRDKVIKIYEDSLLSPEELEKKYPDDPFPDKRTVFNKLKENAEENLFWLKDCLNLDESNKYIITNDWLYEHSMFELVHQLKTIDFEKYDIIEYGW